MRLVGATSYYIAFIVALLPGTALVLILYGFGAVSAILLSASFTAVAFLLFQFTLYKLVYLRLKRINNNLLEKIDASKLKKKLDSLKGLELEKLEHAVTRLIKENTDEIAGLRELEQYRKEFLGDVAHELRSPIFAIQGYLHTLIEGAKDDPEVAERFMTKATASVDHLAKLVEDLVTITRIESGEIKLTLTQFNLGQLIEEVISLQEGEAKKKRISLVFRDESTSRCIVRADRSKIQQVIVNLISNSIKYGRDGGRTTVHLRNTANNAEVQVADNGIGIDKDHLHRIFERFYRIDKSRAKGEGSSVSSGIGLAIVKHILEAHKVKIDVTSQADIGSIFGFSLPCKSEAVSN